VIQKEWGSWKETAYGTEVTAKGGLRKGKHFFAQVRAESDGKDESSKRKKVGGVKPLLACDIGRKATLATPISDGK